MKALAKSKKQRRKSRLSGSNAPAPLIPDDAIESYDTTGLVKTLWFFPWFRRWYINWINRVLPRVNSITLDRKRVFVFPSARGLLFVICSFCVFLAGTNYSNNLILASGFLLLSLFVVTVWHSFLNILGLTVQAGGAEPVFLGEQAQFRIILKRPGDKALFAIKLLWPNSPATMVNIDDEHHKSVKVKITPTQRGYFYPPRLTVETRFPFGTIRCWSHIALDTYCVVYPKPIANSVYLGEGHEGKQGDVMNYQSNEEFYDLKKYEDGDNLTHVAWKSFSKGLGLRSKRFAGYQDESVWLDWQSFNTYEHELKISYLCYWVLRFDKENRRYGLELPGFKIEPDVGEQHRKQCLHALATFDTELNHQSTEGFFS